LGFSTIAATAILGGALISILAILSGTIVPTISDYHESMKNLETRIVERSQTDINITSITNTTGIFYDLNITVKNTGSNTLKSADTTILINGTTKQFNCSTPYLYPNSSGIFTVNLTGTGQKKIKVVTQNGIADYATYIV
jgi:archaellum component FlaF (FlaF/FlaG flagellin family)